MTSSPYPYQIQVQTERTENMSLQTDNYRITRKFHGQALVDFLAQTLRISKRAAKNVLDRRNVYVNGQRIWMARHPLQTGDIVSLPQTLHLVGAGKNGKKTDKIAILWKDEHYLIIAKPAGLLSNGAGSVEYRLQQQRQDPTLRIVHRLDRDTSGCLILARSKPDFDAILPLFRQRAISKTYHAIVHGRMQKGQQRISKPLQGHTAVSHVRVLDTCRQASHLAIKIETGRTHQIRIHLSSVRHPVLGDPRYKSPQEDALALRAAVPRQMLHARVLQFPHPFTAERIRVEAPLPPDFKACLQHLSLT